MKPFFKYENAAFNDEQEKESIHCVRVRYKFRLLRSAFVDAQLAILLIPNGDPRSGQTFLSDPYTYDLFNHMNKFIVKPYVTTKYG